MAQRLLELLAYLNLVGVAGAIGLIHGVGEKTWAVTLFLFGPIWVCWLPLAVLTPLALAIHRKLSVLAALALAAALLPGPVLGFEIPWQRLSAGAPGAPKLRVLTWNVGGHNLSAAEWSELVNTHFPDVVAVQECSTESLDLPGWHFQNDMGMCLLSRFAVSGTANRDRQDVWADGGSGAIVRYSVAAPFGVFELTNVHLETPREGFQSIVHLALRTGIQELTSKNEQRYREAALARSWVDAGTSPARLVVGDFNTPPQSDLLGGVWPEFENCFQASGFGFGHTKETRLMGVRIDHVLASPGWRCSAASVEPGKGSDHHPVVVDLEWRGAPLTGGEPRQ